MNTLLRTIGAPADAHDCLNSAAAARHRLALIAIGALLAGIFLLDLVFPLGVAAGVPYIAAVLLALWVDSGRVRLGVAATAGALTIVGFFMPEPHGEGFWIGLENRLIALFAIAVTAVLGHLLLMQTRAVRERERRLLAVLGTAPDAILTVDADGLIESCNPAAGAMFGRRCELLVGTAISSLLPGLEGEEPTPLRVRSFPANRADGSEFPAEVSISRFPQERKRDGAAPEYVAVVRDVTVLRDVQQRNLRTQRLAAVGETLAVLSHEARNELLALRMGLKMLADTADSSGASLIDDLRSSERRLSRLFEDVRQQAGPIRLNPAPCSVSDVWRRAWKACDRSGRVAELIESLPTGDAIGGELSGEAAADCVADGFRLEQVFRNLFENALAACPDPARIKVEVSSAGPVHAEMVCVSVRDNGPGLSPEARAKAFEPFFTTKSDGTGLGLAICRRVLEAHGGELSLRDADGRGACFDLILPRTGSRLSGASRQLVEA